VIPIRDINHTHRTPIVTWTLIAANVVIFVMGLGIGGPAAEEMVLRFGVIPDVMVHGHWAVPRGEGGAIGSWVTPVTSMFLHGGWLHLGSNMLFLHVFGDNVEDVLGRGRFLLFYTLCGGRSWSTRAAWCR
jgi:membrane associated rhomboid family serine protease